MTINISSLSVVFPAYNEQDNIADSIAKAEHVLNKLNLDYEIIVVNDGSSDSTRDIVEEICRRNERLHIINHETNLGYGAAVWSGISCLSKEYLFFTDSDLQFDLNEINRLLPHVPEYDAVIGYRIKRKDPFMRLLNAWGWNLLNRLLFGLKVRDIDCAFKLFKRKI
ncbi:glycosyltransferase family 2 protein, partial [bacterium]|nr:glycosyltransferase family 2 protein [bacterium]